MNHNRDAYIKKEDIAVWCPISKEIDKYVQHCRETLRERDGFCPPPFQMIERMIRDFTLRLDPTFKPTPTPTPAEQKEEVDEEELEKALDKIT